jgi:hypothetical protein
MLGNKSIRSHERIGDVVMFAVQLSDDRIQTSGTSCPINLVRLTTAFAVTRRLLNIISAVYSMFDNY